MTLQTDTIHPSRQTPELLAARRGLRASEPAFTSPLLGPDFTLAVGAVRDDVLETVGWRACRPTLFWPHHTRRGGLARPIGAPFSDYHAVVADPAVPFSPSELMAASGVSARRFADRPSALTRVSRRLGHIAAAEPTLPGRVKGVLTTPRGASLRLNAGAAE